MTVSSSTQCGRPFIDTHCHLDVSEFADDRQQVLQRARMVGVSAQIIPAIAYSNWQAIADWCATESDCFAAYGLHPMYLARHQQTHIEALRGWIETHPCVAVGEAGLDYFVDDLDHALQQHYLDAQMRLAAELDLPIILHARRAFDQIAVAIRKYRVRAVVHSFSGSWDQAQALFRLGAMIGIGGPVTYERAQRLRSVVAKMPIEHLLLETDAPDQPLAGRQGQRNEPSFLPSVAAVIAELRHTTVDDIAAQTTTNAHAMFRLTK